jgi:hypothetical protein
MDSFNFKFCFSQTPGLFFIALYRELKIDVGLNFFYRVDVVGLSFFLNTNYSSKCGDFETVIFFLVILKTVSLLRE